VDWHYLGHVAFGAESRPFWGNKKGRLLWGKQDAVMGVESNEIAAALRSMGTAKYVD
jgi:hypothetical protein